MGPGLLSFSLHDLGPQPFFVPKREPDEWEIQTPFDRPPFPIPGRMCNPLRNVGNIAALRAGDIRNTPMATGIKRLMMWHPFGPIDWLDDPFERLILIAWDMPSNGNAGIVVTVEGEDSRRRFKRQLREDGYHHERGMPVFCEDRHATAAEFWMYVVGLEERLAQLLEEENISEEVRLGKLERKLASWTTARSVGRLKASGHDFVKTMAQQAKEKKEKEKMAQISNPLGTVFEKFKNDICERALRGGKVALSVGATDEVLVRVVRRAIGRYYPEFFVKNPVGRALEPIVLASVVLLGSYLMKAYTSARLPFQDEVEAAAKYAMEGKFRDLVQLARGPIFMVFHQIGTELQNAETNPVPEGDV